MEEAEARLEVEKLGRGEDITEATTEESEETDKKEEQDKEP